MAKYLLSYDEQDVKNGNLDVSPDGVLRSAGKSGSDEPVLPQKVLFRSTDSEGNILCCGQKASEMTIEEGLALCLSKIPYLIGEEDWFVTGIRIMDTVDSASQAEKALIAAGAKPLVSGCGGAGAEVAFRSISNTEFKQS